MPDSLVGHSENVSCPKCDGSGRYRDPRIWGTMPGSHPCDRCRGRGTVARCGRIMIGSGGDTWDPVCELPDGHTGSCKSSAATDQNRLVV